MKYPRIIAAIKNARWAILPGALQAIADSLGAHMRGRLAAPVSSRRAIMDDDQMPPNGMPMDDYEMDDSTESAENIAVVEVHGILGKHLSSMDTECGGCDVDEVEEEIEEAMADARCRAVVLDFDSPGGVVTGIPELARRIREWTKTKPIYAFTGSQCCSAAYWLASACSGVFCTVTADVGSIGVYVALVDDTEWWKQEGYKLELVKAGKFKAMGISGQPLAPEERALIQSDVDAVYAMFTSDVRAARPGVDDASMQGQTFMGANAVMAGLADEVCGGMDELLQEIAES